MQFSQRQLFLVLSSASRNEFTTQRRLIRTDACNFYLKKTKSDIDFFCALLVSSLDQTQMRSLVCRPARGTLASRAGDARCAVQRPSHHGDCRACPALFSIPTVNIFCQGLSAARVFLMRPIKKEQRAGIDGFLIAASFRFNSLATFAAFPSGTCVVRRNLF